LESIVNRAIAVSAFSFLKCFDTVNWVTGRASGP